MIVTNDLSKTFEDFVAVDGVNLKVEAGEVLALLGPNGAGKTTTVRMLTSILRPSRGTASIAGYDVVENAAKVRSLVGVLTEHHGLYGRMRAAEYLHFFGELYGLDKKTRHARTDELLNEFGLHDSKTRRIGEFSKGMRQKLALARALLHSPKVLLLDEPTSAMDPASARLVRDAIQELRTGDRAIIICTHNLAEAEELADRIAIIRNGIIIANDSPRNLKEKLLGPAEFEVRLAQSLNGRTPAFPNQANITSQGENWLRFVSSDPQTVNPLVLSKLIEQKIPVVSLSEVPRSLEQVYLQVVAAPMQEEN